jgi:tryptophan synthase alpha chain
MASAEAAVLADPPGPSPAVMGDPGPGGRFGPFGGRFVPAGLDATLMVTPATPAAQRRVIAARTRGFLYVMSVMATTGTTAEQDPSRWAVAAQARAGGATRPVLIGFGIGTPGRAAAVVRHADGVIVASALMRRVLDGATAAEVGHAVGELRAAVDGARPRISEEAP